MFMNAGRGIYKKEGAKRGKTVAIFAGVHGNETVGIITLDKVRREVVIEAGTVYFVYANPLAITKNVREVTKNLNRCFFAGNRGVSYEDHRARELMELLDRCDALLDIHAFNDQEGEPFIITESEGFPIAEKLYFGIVSSGWSTVEFGGTDSYMHVQGKPGLSLECGPVAQAASYVPLAEKSLYQFLHSFGCIKQVVASTSQTQHHIQVTKVLTKTTNNFSYVKPFRNFEKLPDDTLFAVDGDIPYVAGKNECIIFPRPDKPIGGEAGLIGKLAV